MPSEKNREIIAELRSRIDYSKSKNDKWFAGYHSGLMDAIDLLEGKYVK